ncbi:hypothetical protein E3N88_31997 [Mikania micrantha]|uniref:Retrotransposon gag domain-containing protein n=1 Tax=Mikania micrantha TaxID=192012 RepID=A0A5N6M9W4_9ASTR|nr:hypothetical protein E3N88_31997 [Mikania micrantha]
MHQTRLSGPPQFASFDEPERELHRRFRICRLPLHSTDMAAPPRRTVADYAKPTAAGTRSSIARPVVTEDNWHIPAQIINLIIHSPKFHGLPDEDPNAHVGQFLRICDTFKIKGVSDDAVFLRLFPFSLEDKAITWLESLPTGSITTWDEMQEMFLTKYFPPAKTARLRSLIHSFQQEEGESFFTTWERFKELLNKCPHHGLENWALVEKFYNGVTFATRHTLDSTAGGNLLTNLTPDECLQLFENMAMSSYQYPTRGKATVQKSGVLPVDSNTALVAQVEALTKMVKDLQAKGNAKCEICRGGHDTRQCPMLADDSHEQVKYAGNFNRGPGNAYGNSYNSGGRNQPDFTWKNGNPSGFNQHPHEQSGVTDERMARLEELMVQQTQMLTQVIATNQTVSARYDELIKTQGAAILSLDRKLEELADQLKERKPCESSSNTEKNPKGFVNAVTTRCGKFMGEEELSAEPVQEEEPVDEEIEVEVSGKVHPTRLSPASTAQPVQPHVEKEKPKEVEIDLSRVPYPARILQQKYEKEYGKFLELFRQLKVNLPFSDVLQHMPKYAKFLKDLLMKKKNWEEISAVTLSERCFAGSPKELPQKMSDPGSFTIPCDLGGSSVSYALADLGASINLMPYSIFAKLNLGEPMPTRMTIQLADRSVKYPRGIVQNVLVKIDKFLFPVDFVILDMEEDERVPLILGGPFLATARALIDVGDGRLTLQVENESQQCSTTLKELRTAPQPTAEGPWLPAHSRQPTGDADHPDERLRLTTGNCLDGFHNASNSTMGELEETKWRQGRAAGDDGGEKMLKSWEKKIWGMKMIWGDW